MTRTKSWEGVAGRLIRLTRQRAGLSQEDLARAAGIGQPLISQYEAGKVQPTLPTLHRLIQGAGAHLNIDVDGLRPLDTQRMPTDEETLGIERAFIRMLEDQPHEIRRQHDAARRRWGKTLGEFVDTGRPAFPGYKRGS